MPWSTRGPKAITLYARNMLLDPPEHDSYQTQTERSTHAAKMLPHCLSSGQTTGDLHVLLCELFRRGCRGVGYDDRAGEVARPVSEGQVVVLYRTETRFDCCQGSQ